MAEEQHTTIQEMHWQGLSWVENQCCATVGWVVAVAAVVSGAHIVAERSSAAGTHMEDMVMEVTPGKQHHMHNSRSWDCRRSL